MLRDNELRIGWGKAVTIPPAALAATAIPASLAAVAAAKGASVPPPGMAASLPWANQALEPERKPHDGNGEDQLLSPLACQFTRCTVTGISKRQIFCRRLEGRAMNG